MNHRRFARLASTIVALAGLLLSAVSFSGTAFGAAAKSREPLEMYTATLTRPQAAKLARDGYDIAATRQAPGGVEVDLVLTVKEAARLRGQGLAIGVKKNRDGKTATQLAAEQAANGYNVWRSYDQPGGIRDELYQIAQANPSRVKLEVIGHSLQGREIIALKVTQGAGLPDGTRPAVLYSATQHAREWISTEVNRRLLHYFVDNYGTTPEVTDLVNTRELWFVPVANPDGYQFTFDVERLWRKNLRDNNGDGQITVGDGVDPNRNFDEHWNYDNEGSSTEASSDTYRGSGPASEPETQAMQGLLNRLKFKFMVNYHSYGQLLLYSFGWQVQTPSADGPIFLALSGTDANPAISGFDPGVGADLYTTNGETTDYAHAKAGTLAWTPELGEGIAGNGFVFPDDEGLIQAEFERNLPFALDVATSAPNPAQPVSHLGNTVKPFYLDMSSTEPELSGNPQGDFRFAVSYGDPQIVQVLAARSLGAVTLKYQINGGPTQSKPTAEWNGGERFGGPGDIYYHIVRGQVTGTQPGNSVKVWFEGGGQVSESFTYLAKVESNARVLVLAAEDYTGISPVYKKTNGPSYLSYYLDALAANGTAADVYDVDANGRKAPSALGVLSHYKAVIWYTGDDVLTREPGMVPGTASRLANDEMLAVRAYLNEGGRLLYTGKYAGFGNAGGYEFNPETNAPCNPNDSGEDGCLALSDDFLQYYLGAYVYNDDAGTTANGKLYTVNGADEPFNDLSWSFGGPSANNQDHSASFIATSGILPAATYPQFSSAGSAKYARPGGPFDPHTGQYYAYSQIADISYKRLTRTIDLSGQSSGNLSFWISRDTEPDWDFVFVEAHTVGQDNWTTLPDQNGHTSPSTGPQNPDLASCPGGWHELHPFLEHYQTFDGVGSCTSTGTTGTWNAASGRSNGWEQWSIDLSAYAGQPVEISIAYVSDWSVQGLGVFIDDTTISTGASTSFEDNLGGWTVTGPAPGSAPNGNNFIRTDSSGFPEGAAITTEDAIYFGFGFEGIATPSSRNTVMKRVTDYLLR
ncbi:MAG TPA: M14 family zinc carboxypeptidase [Roseiflexaceae bacterium]|nr:M14 family zinc carboxypeptidase [Roseiflexaceae bacterium]